MQAWRSGCDTKGHGSGVKTRLSGCWFSHEAAHFTRKTTHFYAVAQLFGMRILQAEITAPDFIALFGEFVS